MTSNEEIYYLTHKYKKVCIPGGWTISVIAPKPGNVEQENENVEQVYENVEMDYPELQAEIDEASLWNF